MSHGQLKEIKIVGLISAIKKTPFLLADNSLLLQSAIKFFFALL